jgi:hypothetical protein
LSEHTVLARKNFEDGFEKNASSHPLQNFAEKKLNLEKYSCKNVK